MSVIAITTTKYKTSRLNNPAYVKNRIYKKLRDSFYFLLAKWLFHFISIFSTTMMLSSSLVDWVKVPLSNIGIDLMQYGNDLFLPTVLISVAMSLTLEITTTKTMSSTIEALRVNSGLFDITVRVIAMSILIATQLYTFVGGAKNTLIFALVPTTYQEEIKSNKKRVAHYENLEDIISKKITAVKDGTGATDDIYGSGTGAFIQKFEISLDKAKAEHLAYIKRERSKAINLDTSGKFTRIAKALIYKRYMEFVKPIEDSYNKAKSSKLDKKKLWLLSAKNDLLEQRTFKQKYLNQVTQIESEYKSKLDEVSDKIKDIYYWYGAIFLLFALSAMDFMHGRTLDEALKGFDNAKNSFKNKDGMSETNTFNPEKYQAKEEPKREPFEDNQARSMNDVFNRHIVETKAVNDNDFLQYIADKYLQDRKVPSTQTIVNEFGKSTRDITEIFKRNEHYFKRINGIGTVVTNEFLSEYNLDWRNEKAS